MKYEKMPQDTFIHIKRIKYTVNVLKVKNKSLKKKKVLKLQISKFRIEIEIN
jgi:hypothetical protein